MGEAKPCAESTPAATLDADDAQLTFDGVP